jgi:hypothetical protein
MTDQANCAAALPTASLSRFASINAIFRKPKPSGGHSIASGRASNASVAVRASAAGEPRVEKRWRLGGCICDWTNQGTDERRQHPSPFKHGTHPSVLK